MMYASIGSCQLGMIQAVGGLSINPPTACIVVPSWVSIPSSMFNMLLGMLTHDALACTVASALATSYYST